jgi:hypothetical protein
MGAEVRGLVLIVLGSALLPTAAMAESYLCVADHVTGYHYNKVMRMAAQTAAIEAGAVHLPTRVAWMEDFKKEILSFPMSRHDDQIDALSQALQRAFAPPPPQAVFSTYSMFAGR